MPSVQKGEPLRVGCAGVGEWVGDGNAEDARGRIYWSEGVSPSNVLPPGAGDLSDSPTAGGRGFRKGNGAFDAGFSGLGLEWAGVAP